MTIDRLRGLAQAVEAGTLPAAEFTHQAHIEYAAWTILTLGPDAALPRIRQSIQRLNEAHGKSNTSTAGYHETITRFYVDRITRELCATTVASCIVESIAQAVDALEDRSLPLRHWSRDRLFSPEARGWWLEPDQLSL
jgi:hypothetical protein